MNRQPGWGLTMQLNFSAAQCSLVWCSDFKHSLLKRRVSNGSVFNGPVMKRSILQIAVFQFAIYGNQLCIPCWAAPTSVPPATAIRNIFAPAQIRESLNTFQDPTTGLSFCYPKSWKEESDKDAIVKFNGTTSTGEFGEIKLGHNVGFSDVDAVIKVIGVGLEQLLPGFKKISTEKIRFGDRYQLTGTELIVSFTFNGTPMFNRFIFFVHGGEVQSISFVCQAEQYQKMQPLFDRLLLTVHSTSGSTHIASSTGQTSVQSRWQLKTYSDKSGKISLSYPDGWQLKNNDPGKDLDIKFVGKSADGMGGELFLSRLEMPPGMTLDQFADTFEETYLKPLKDFRKNSTRRSAFGVSREEAIIRDCTFSAEGHRARHDAAFFSSGGQFYCLALNTIYWKEQDCKDLFERVLASVKLSP